MADIEIDPHGSVIRFTPLSDFAREWIDEHLAPEPWQWLGNSLVLDCQVAIRLLPILEQHGLDLTV